jgi:hypothetical protein
MLLFYAIAGPKCPIMYEGRLQRRGHDTCFNFVVVSKLDLVPTTDAGSYQTDTLFTSRQCVEGAGVGDGASDDGKGMIVMGVIGQGFDIAAC